jgi:proline iminopeptidase
MKVTVRTPRPIFLFLLCLSPVVLAPALSGSCLPHETVDEEHYVESDLAQLYLRIKGAEAGSPLLLYLHGGPGMAVGLLHFQAYPGPELEKHFVVVYYHQRGVLKSPPVPDDTQTIAQHIRDVKNVLKFLKKRFNKDRVYLVGHSWGGTLGFLYLLEHPEDVAAIACDSAPFNLLENEKCGYEATLKWAEESGNRDATAQLRSIGPPPYESPEELNIERKWSSGAFGGMTRNLSMERIIVATGFSPDPSWQETMVRIASVMEAEIMAINLDEAVGRIKTPLLLICGRLDLIVPGDCIVKGFEKYGGPKELVFLENSHHFPALDEPELYAAKIIEFFEKQ